MPLCVDVFDYLFPVFSVGPGLARLSGAVKGDASVSAAAAELELLGDGKKNIWKRCCSNFRRRIIGHDSPPSARPQTAAC